MYVIKSLTLYNQWVDLVSELAKHFQVIIVQSGPGAEWYWRVWESVMSSPAGSGAVS